MTQENTMSFLEDLFEGRNRGHRGGHDGHDGDHHDGHYREPDHRPRYGPSPGAPATVCGQCRAPVAMLPGYRFCPYCGGSLAATSACTGCGAARVTGAAFCGTCGAKV
jgi:hypothetical protein